MKKIILFLGFVFFANVIFVSGQSKSKIKKLDFQATTLFQYDNFNKALNLYLMLDSIVEGKDPFYKLQIAICYLNTNIAKNKAVSYLTSIKDEAETFLDDYYYYLGRAYHLDYSFDHAIEAYEKFLELLAEDNDYRIHNDSRIQYVQRQIKMCSNAKQLVANPIDVKIENMGSKINSPYEDNSPVISADETIMLFTSRREECMGGLLNIFGKPDAFYGEYFEDIFVSVNINNEWKSPSNVGGVINSEGHDAAIGLSPDGEQLFVYRSDSSRWGNIFTSSLDGYEWGVLKKMPSPINTKSWEGSISMTSSGNTIYIASNRPGGYGGKDIYKVNKLPNGEWAEAFNLGAAINTPYDDVAAFIHPDEKTLYFSSQGHNSMGGFDIFKSTFTDGKWAEPANLQYPINTPDDEVDFVISADGKRGYYASVKEDGYGDKDIYVIHMPKEYLPEALTLIKGFISGCEGEIPEDATIFIKDNITQELIAINKPNKTTGKYLLAIPKDKDYSISFQAGDHITFNKNFKTTDVVEYSEINMNIELECVFGN